MDYVINNNGAFTLEIVNSEQYCNLFVMLFLILRKRATFLLDFPMPFYILVLSGLKLYPAILKFLLTIFERPHRVKTLANFKEL